MIYQVFSVSIFFLLTYSAGVILVFITLNQFDNITASTNFTLYKVRPYTFHQKLLLVAFLSMAGVPPFLGFFTKLSILTLLVNNAYFYLFVPLFVLMFSSLYFYIQNIRVILTSTDDLMDSFSFNKSIETRFTPLLITFGFFFYTFLTLGFLFLDDLILTFFWLLS